MLPPADLAACIDPQIRIPVAVADPAAEITIEALCDPELHGHAAVATSIDPRRCGRPYRYIYCICITRPRPCNTLTGICRVDVTDGSVVTFDDLPNIPLGMPVFVPRPGAAADDESDGVVLLDYFGSDGKALVIVLDGKSFKEVARVTVPHRECMSLHNTWMWD